ncbi:hypothetical protein ACFV9C_42895 [Kribbella sp. NPDC059898]|uniref:hypothetical protein n=1 Tax=Kribbella sp. NPDC059898 TaxID=3346995 RepID=UPI00364DC0C4
MDVDPTSEISYDDVIVMTRWMASEGFTPDEIAYAVEKPHKHLDYVHRAAAGLAPEQ